MSHCRKLIAVITALCFLFSFICAPALEAALEMLQTTHPAIAVPNTEQLLIPASIGSITCSKDFKSAFSVITIQDLHCNPEVQKNITKILETLDEKYGLKNVYVEGGFGDVDTSWLARLPNTKIKNKIAQALIDSGRLTGSEYYSITTGKPHLLKGLEDEKLHTQNIIRLGRILGQNTSFTETTAKLDDDIALLKARYLTHKNNKLNTLIKDYRDHTITTQKYYKRIKHYIDTINDQPDTYNALFKIRMSNYPNTAAYLDLLELNTRLDSPRITRELQTLMQQLRTKLPYSAYTAIVKQTDNFSKTDTLYDMLDRIAREQKIDLSRNYPDLNRFFTYLEKRKAVNPVQLIQEEKLLIEELRIALSSDINEVEVSFLADFYDTFKDYLFNKLSANDYEYFVSRFDKFKTIWAKYTYTNHLKDLEAQFPVLDEYYKVNNDRTNSFVENILKDNSHSVIVMITGGFHSEGLQKLLEERKISYSTITPNIVNDTAGSASVYQEIIKEEAAVFSRQALSHRLYTQMSPEMWPTLNGMILGFSTGEYIEVSSDGKKITIVEKQRSEIASTIQKPSIALDIEKAARYGAQSAAHDALEQLDVVFNMLVVDDLVPVMGMLYFLARNGMLSGNEMSYPVYKSGEKTKTDILTFLAQTIDKVVDMNVFTEFPDFAQDALLDHVTMLQTLDKTTPDYIKAVDDLYALLIRLNGMFESRKTPGAADVSAVTPESAPLATHDTFNGELRMPFTQAREIIEDAVFAAVGKAINAKAIAAIARAVTKVVREQLKDNGNPVSTTTMDNAAFSSVFPDLGRFVSEITIETYPGVNGFIKTRSGLGFSEVVSYRGKQNAKQLTIRVAAGHENVVTTIAAHELRQYLALHVKSSPYYTAFNEYLNERGLVRGSRSRATKLDNTARAYVQGDGDYLYELWHDYVSVHNSMNAEDTADAQLIETLETRLNEMPVPVSRLAELLPISSLVSTPAQVLTVSQIIDMVKIDAETVRQSLYLDTDTPDTLRPLLLRDLVHAPLLLRYGIAITKTTLRANPETLYWRQSILTLLGITNPTVTELTNKQKFLSKVTDAYFDLLAREDATIDKTDVRKLINGLYGDFDKLIGLPLLFRNGTQLADNKALKLNKETTKKLMLYFKNMRTKVTPPIAKRIVIRFHFNKMIPTIAIETVSDAPGKAINDSRIIRIWTMLVAVLVIALVSIGIAAVSNASPSAPSVANYPYSSNLRVPMPQTILPHNYVLHEEPTVNDSHVRRDETQGAVPVKKVKVKEKTEHKPPTAAASRSTGDDTLNYATIISREKAAAEKAAREAQEARAAKAAQAEDARTQVTDLLASRGFTIESVGYVNLQAITDLLLHNGGSVDQNAGAIANILRLSGVHVRTTSYNPYLAKNDPAEGINTTPANVEKMQQDIVPTVSQGLNYNPAIIVVQYPDGSQKWHINPGGDIAIDPNLIERGSWVMLTVYDPNDNPIVFMTQGNDTGGAINGDHVDVSYAVVSSWYFEHHPNGPWNTSSIFSGLDGVGQMPGGVGGAQNDGYIYYKISAIVLGLFTIGSLFAAIATHALPIAMPFSLVTYAVLIASFLSATTFGLGWIISLSVAKAGKTKRGMDDELNNILKKSLGEITPHILTTKEGMDQKKFKNRFNTSSWVAGEGVYVNAGWLTKSGTIMTALKKFYIPIMVKHELSHADGHGEVTAYAVMPWTFMKGVASISAAIILFANTYIVHLFQNTALAVTSQIRHMITFIRNSIYGIKTTDPLRVIVSQNATGIETDIQTALEQDYVTVIVQQVPQEEGKDYQYQKAGAKDTWAKTETIGDKTVTHIYIAVAEGETFANKAAEYIRSLGKPESAYAIMEGTTRSLKALKEITGANLNGHDLMVLNLDADELPLSKEQSRGLLVKQNGSPVAEWPIEKANLGAQRIATAPEIGFLTRWSNKLLKITRFNRSLLFTVEDIGKAGKNNIETLQSRGAKVYVMYTEIDESKAKTVIKDFGLDGIVFTNPKAEVSTFAAEHKDLMVAGATVSGTDAQARPYVTINLNEQNEQNIEQQIKNIPANAVVRVQLARSEKNKDRIVLLGNLSPSHLVIFEGERFWEESMSRDITQIMLFGVNVLELLHLTPKTPEEINKVMRTEAYALGIGTFEKYDNADELQADGKKVLSGIVDAKNLTGFTRNQNFFKAIALRALELGDAQQRAAYLTAVFERLQERNERAEAGRFGDLEDITTEMKLGELIHARNNQDKHIQRQQPDATVMATFKQNADTVRGSLQLKLDLYKQLKRQEAVLEGNDSQAQQKALSTMIELLKLYAGETIRVNYDGSGTAPVSTDSTKAILEAA